MVILQVVFCTAYCWVLHSKGLANNSLHSSIQVISSPSEVSECLTLADSEQL